MTTSRQAPQAGAEPNLTANNVTLRGIAESLRRLVTNQETLLEYLASISPAIEDLTDALEDLPHKLNPRTRRTRGKGEPQ